MKPSINYDRLADMVADRIASKLLSGEIGPNEDDGEDHLDLNGLMRFWGTGRSKTYEILKGHNTPVLRVDGKLRVAKKYAREIVSDNTRPIDDEVQ